jgi:hypothetical protein
MKRYDLLKLISTPLSPIVENRIKTRRKELRKVKPMIRLDEIIRHLDTHPRLVEQWEFYSQDKRSSPGYYLEFEIQKRIMGYFDGNISHSIVETTDPALIVALFIIFESQIHDLVFHLS